MTMKTHFSGRDKAQVQAMAKEANRTGSWEGDPQNLGEHLNEIPDEQHVLSSGKVTGLS